MRADLSAADAAWLRVMDRAMEGPVAMVSGGQYQDVVDSRDGAVRRIQVMRANRRRLWARYQRVRRRLVVTEIVAAVVFGGLIVWKW